MRQNEVKEILDVRPDLRQYLFPRGFLLTENAALDTTGYPFYGAWKEYPFFGYCFLVHPAQSTAVYQNGEVGFALIGHAYEPVQSLEYRETELLKEAARRYAESEQYFLEYFNRWTGLFALFIYDRGQLRIFGDPAGMYTIFYGFHDGKFYASSHTKLLGDICALQQDDYIRHLVQYRFYSLFGRALPGDLSPYAAFKRMIPNHTATVSENTVEVSRFFPSVGQTLYTRPYSELIAQASDILHNSMGLIYKKWAHCAISLTGGCDSKTTLSCTADNYDKYDYFSYISSDTEAVDAKAAAEICKMLEIPHHIYEISENDADFPDLDLYKKIMVSNSGDIGKNNANDDRKQVYFIQNPHFDVEVKSWVSEVGRAYYHKRFAKKKFPKDITPRYATALYKVFLHNRKLVRETDAVFSDYLKKYYTPSDFENTPWYDLFFWEFRMSSWNGLVTTGAHQTSYTITIPYNNRELLWLLLSTPIEKRIADEPHWDMMKRMNPKIHNCGISVTNVKHTKKRAKMERLYLDVSTKLPF